MGSEVNSVVIVGERVDLTDGSSRNLKPVTVNFTEYYVPTDISEEDKPRLKKLFRDVFTKSIETSLPCNLKDKALIKKSLQFRAIKLRDELRAISRKDSVPPREATDHFRNLDKLLDRFDSLPCIDSVPDVGNGKLGELNDDRIDRLLKEFIFVLLQAHMPIDAYKNKTAYAQDIVRRLLTDPVVDFDAVLKAFNGKIPKRLQDLLTCMNSVTPSQIELMMKERMKELTADSIKMIEKVYGPEDPFWYSVKKDDILNIIDNLLQSIQALEDELKEKEKELDALRSSKKATNDLGLGQLPARIQALEEEVAKLRAKIEALEGAAKGGDDVKKLKAALEAAQGKNVELQGHIARLEQELIDLRGSGAVPDIAALEKKAAEAEARAAAAEAKLAAAKATAAAGTAPDPNLAQLQKEADDARAAAVAAKAALDAARAGGTHALSNLQGKMKELEATIATLNRQLAEQKATALVTLTPEQLAQLMAKLDEQNRLLADQERLVAEFRQKLEAAEKRTKNNPEANRLLKEALGKLEANELTLEAQITKLGLELLALKGTHAEEGQIANKTTEIARLQGENEAYKKSIIDLQALNDRIKAEVEELKKKLAQKEASLGSGSSSQSALDGLNKEIGELKEQIELLTQEYNAAKDALDSVGEDFNDVMRIVNELEEALDTITASKDAEILAIKDELTKLKARCPEHVNTSGNTTVSQETGGTAEEKAMANLFKYLIRKTQDLSEGLKRNEAGLKTNEAIDTFINAIKENEAALKGCDAEGVKAKAAIDAVTAELNDIRAKAGASGAAGAALAAELDATKIELTAAEAAKEAATAALKAAIAEAKVAREANEANEAAVKAAAELAADIAAEAKAAAEAAAASLEKANTTVTEATELLTAATTKVTDLESKVKELEERQAATGIVLEKALADLAAAQKALANKKEASNAEKAAALAAQAAAIQAATAAAEEANMAAATARTDAEKVRTETNTSKRNSNAVVAATIARAEAAEKAAAEAASSGSAAAAAANAKAEAARKEATAAAAAADAKAASEVAAAEARAVAAEARAAAAEKAKVAIEAAAKEGATAAEQANARAAAAEAAAERVREEHAAAIAAAEASGRENAARARAEADAAAASLTSLQRSGAEKDQRLAAAEAAVVAAQASQAAAEQQAADSRAEAEAAKKNAAASKDEETRVRAKITDAYTKLTEAGRREAAAAAVMADANRKVESAGNSEVEARAATAAAAAATEAARVATEEAAAVKEEAANGLIKEAARISAEAQLAVTAAQKERDEAITAKNAAEQQAAASKEAAAKALAEKEAALAAAKEAQARSAILEAQLLDTAAEIDASIEAQTGLQGANADLQRKLEECKTQLTECLESSRKNKADIALIIAALRSKDEFDPNVKGEDGENLKKEITELLQYVDKETTSNAVIVKLAEELKAGKIPTPTELKITQDSPLAQLIEAIRALKMPPVAKEEPLTEICYLLLFTSHILSTHFPIDEKDPIKNAIKNAIKDVYINIVSDLREKSKSWGTNLGLVLNILMPILSIMNQIYQSGKDGSFRCIPKEFNTSKGAELFTLFVSLFGNHLKGQTTQTINAHFSQKTGSDALSKIYIVFDNPNKSFDIINNQSENAQLVSGIKLDGSYSSIMGNLGLAIESSNPLIVSGKASRDNRISYPVLFYFFIFTFKQYLFKKQNEIVGKQCRLPKIFQA